jgi:HAE1 family hydrophobic/amphiphilic exporter-1
MFLSDISIKRPVMTTMAVMVFVVLGFFSYRRLAVDLLPKVDFPYVTVSTVYPGAGPEEVESQVTKKIEDAVSTLSSVKRIDSTSRENLSLVVIEFELGVDVDLASMDVKDEVNAILVDLPDEIDPPVIKKFDINAMPIMELAISADRPLEEVYRITDDVIRDRLSRVSGVADVEIVGGKEREIEVDLDRDRLKAYGLSVMDVVGGIAGDNLTVPTGRITEKNREYSLRVLGEFKDIEGLKELKFHLDGGGEVYLSSLGKVVDGFKEQRETASYEGKSAVGLVIKKRGDANTVGTAHGIKAALTELGETLPSDLRIDIAQDRSKYIEESIRDVLTNIFIGIFLTALLLYLFLHDLRVTLIAAVSMPTSIVATFLLIDFAGFTINVMTLLALGISIGVLVTNAIVVLENIERYRRKGEEPAAAAAKGTGEIAVAVVTSTLTNVVVFTPIAFMSGIIGQFFIQFGMTVVFATLFSLLVSFTLTPLLAAKVLRSGGEAPGGPGKNPLRGVFEAWDRFYSSVEGSYRSGLEWSLSHRGAVIWVSILAFGLAIFLFRYIGGEFIPSGDQGLISVRVDMPPGTPLFRTEQTLEEMESIARRLPEVESIMATVGGENRGVENGELILRLKDRSERERDIMEVMNDLRPRLAGIPAAEIFVQQSSGFRNESDIIIEITGKDFDRLRGIANRVAGMAGDTGGLVDVRTSWKEGKPEVVFSPDRKMLADYDLSVARIAGEIRAMFEGVTASLFWEGGEEYDIRV